MLTCVCVFVCVCVCAFQITATDHICIVKEKIYRKLIIKNCTEDDSGKYRCEADGRKTEAELKVEGIVLSQLEIIQFKSNKGQLRLKKYSKTVFVLAE